MGARPGIRALVERLWPGARLELLAGDGSARTFHRVRPRSGPCRVLMDYGAPFAADTDDVLLLRLFRSAGLPVAELLEVVPDPGCLVLEDLGDRSLEAELRSIPVGSEPPQALGRAVDLAADVAVRGTPVLARSVRAAGPALDAERFRFEMDFFLEHFVGELRGIRPSAALAAELGRLADRAAAGPRVLCHRDFHSRNLMLRPDGSPAMVDVQDARWGPDGYDLASILRDAYLPVPEGWIEPLVARYLARRPDVDDPGTFRERLAVLAAQRMLKALGSFAWLTRSRDPARYLPAIPPTVERLERLLPGIDATRELGRLLDRESALTG